MATSHVSTSPARKPRRSAAVDPELRARAQALGYELVIADNGHQFVLGGEQGLDVLFIKRGEDDTFGNLPEWLAAEEAKEAAEAGADVPLRIRKQLSTGYELVSAARLLILESRDRDALGDFDPTPVDLLLGRAEDLLADLGDANKLCKGAPR